MNSEQAFDMLPYAVDIFDKLDIDGYRKEIAEKYKDKQSDNMAVGIEVFRYIFKNAGKVKTEFFQIVAIAENKSLEEVKAQSLAKTIIAIKAVFSDKELVDFFRQAMQ